MEDLVWWQPRDVRNSLARLDLTPELLRHAVRAGHVARISRTKNDSVIAPGLYQWNDSVRSLREQLVPMGWRRGDTRGIPTIIHPDGRLAICVSSGDENTGFADKHPGTRHVKGPSTARFVASNALQIGLGLEFFTPPPVAAQSEADGTKIATWTLLFYSDRNEIRSELSLPIFMSGGQITGWRERIILPIFPTDGDSGLRETEPEFGPDFDIDIRRLA